MAKPEADQTLKQAKALGSSHVAIVLTWYVPDAQHLSPGPDPQRSSTLDELEALTRKAKALGLKVLLKPHIGRLDGGSRTQIVPASLDTWWAAYRGYLLQIAELGQRTGAEALAVGTELAGVSGHTQRWEALIQEIRQRFAGQLTYAANWDEIEAVRFLDRLDWVGIDAYYPLAPKGAGTTLDLVQGWQTHLARLHRMHALRTLPLIITEAGAPSEDPAAQANEYRAALVALRREGGLFFWNLWEGDHGGTYVMQQPARETLWGVWR